MGKDFCMNIERAKARVAREQSKLARLLDAEKEARRKDNTKRKILVGAATLAAYEAGAIKREALRAVLDRFLTAERDRRVFDGSELELPRSRGAVSESAENISDSPSAAPATAE